jgi:hypothetical protein
LAGLEKDLHLPCHFHAAIPPCQAWTTPKALANTPCLEGVSNLGTRHNLLKPYIAIYDFHTLPFSIMVKAQDGTE